MLKILIVDDDPDVLEMWTDMVARVAPEVTGLLIDLRTAESAYQAIRILGQWTPDVLVTDVRMPGMGGIELLGEIRRRHPPFACYLVTGHPDAPEVVEALESGLAKSVIAKPFTVDTIRLWFMSVAYFDV